MTTDPEIISKTLIADEDTFYLCEVSSSVYVGDSYEDPLQCHHVTFRAENEELGVAREIGGATMYTLQCEADSENRGVFDILDEESENLMHIGAAMCYGSGARKINDEFMWYDPNFVFVSTASLVPECRGFGLGPYLVARTLTSAFRLYDAALLQAFPINAAEMDKDAIKPVQRKIIKAWKSIGFKKLADDVFIANISAMKESPSAAKKREALTLRRAS